MAFQIEGLNNREEYEIRLFDLTGKSIDRVRLSAQGSGRYTGTAPGGLIFFQLVNRSSGEVIGAGRMIRTK